MLMYSWSLNLLIWAKFHWKIPLGKAVFKFWPKSKWREMKIGYLAAILKWYKYFIFCPEKWFWLVYKVPRTEVGTLPYAVKC